MGVHYLKKRGQSPVRDRGNPVAGVATSDQRTGLCGRRGRGAGGGAAAAGGRVSLGQQNGRGGPEKVALPRPGTGGSLAASAGTAGPAWPRWPGGLCYSPCRESSSNGASGEPREVMPGPPGARPPPARLFFAAAEARAGLSALPGSRVRPDSPPGRRPPRGADTVGRADESSAAPAPPGSAEAERQPGASRARRPRPAAPRPPRAAPGPAGPPRRPGSHSPQLSPSYSRSSRAPLGSAPPTGPCRSPGQPRLQRDAWRPTRGASAAQLVRPPPVRGAARAPAPSASAGDSEPLARRAVSALLSERSRRDSSRCRAKIAIWPVHFLPALSSVT